MKKVLVTGAAGAIGLGVIKYLLSEGKYEITALDLKNKKVFKRLHKYHKRINIIYGDILDRNLIDNLVKEQDVIINLASVLPPLAEYKNNLSSIIEYNGTENLIRAISYYNPKCHLIYASTTSLNLWKNSKEDPSEDDYFSYAKYKTENLIIKKLKNFTILRVPLVLSDLRCEPFIYSICKEDIIETITKEDASYAFVSCIDKLSKVNTKVYNLGGGSSCTTEYKKLLYYIIKYHGLSWHFIASSLFLTKSYHSPVCNDTKDSQKVLKYQNDSLQSYYMRQKRRSNKRVLAKFFGKIYLAINKRRVHK